MMTSRWWCLGAVGLILLAYPIGLAQAHPSDHVIANGGLTVSDGSHMLQGTVGQAIVGSSLGPSNMLMHGFWAAGVLAVDAVGPQGPLGLPQELSFGFPHPNPARAVVLFGLSLPQAGRVALVVYDVAGRQVGDRLEKALEAGNHTLKWQSPADFVGILFARLSVDGRLAGTRRIVLLP